MWWVLDSFWPPEPKTFDSYFLDKMYVEFMKNFFLAESSELLGVRLISASWAQKRLIPTLQTSCTSNSWEIFYPYFLDMIYVGFMKNFFVADTSELLAVLPISASLAQKRLIPTS